jgi:hypothetical protein
MMLAEPPRDEAPIAAAVVGVRRRVLALLERVSAENNLPVWVVSADTAGGFEARLWLLRPSPYPTPALLSSGSLDELRSFLPPGLLRVERSRGDDRRILETWL